MQKEINNKGTAVKKKALLIILALIIQVAHAASQQGSKQESLEERRAKRIAMGAYKKILPGSTHQAGGRTRLGVQQRANNPIAGTVQPLQANGNEYEERYSNTINAVRGMAHNHPSLLEYYRNSGGSVGIPPHIDHCAVARYMLRQYAHIASQLTIPEHTYFQRCDGTTCRKLLDPAKKYAKQL